MAESPNCPVQGAHQQTATLQQTGEYTQLDVLHSLLDVTMNALNYTGGVQASNKSDRWCLIYPLPTDLTLLRGGISFRSSFQHLMAFVKIHLADVYRHTS
ncbi:hypothetical protein J6590_058941 [Homalodisca vitripennis]|nr:hypothetical protein J6590_058941 [Homalodisca vitripennis]